MHSFIHVLIYSSHLTYPLLIHILINNTYIHISLYMSHTLRTQTYTPILKSTHPHIPYTRHHKYSFTTTLNFLHTPYPHTYSPIHTLTLTWFLFSHPQWYVLKLCCAPSKHRIRKENRWATFRCSEHFRLPSWTEQDACCGLMAHSGHRYSPEVSHHSGFLGKAVICHLPHVATWRTSDTLTLLHWAGAQSLQVRTQGKVLQCTLCEIKHKCLLGMYFSLC